MRVVNMAHGAFFLLGGYIALRVQRNMVGGGSASASRARRSASRSGSCRRSSRWRSSPAVGLIMQQLLLRWNQGQDLRQALITIASRSSSPTRCSPTSAASRRTSPGRARSTSSSTSSVYDIQYTLTRLVILGIGLAIGARALVLAQADAHRHGHPRGRRRPRHGLRDRDQHPADVRDRLRRRVRRWPASAAPSAGRSRASRPGVDANWLLNSLVVVIIGGMGSLGGAAIGVAAARADRRTSPPPTCRRTTPSTRSSSRSSCWRSCSPSARSGSSGDPHEHGRCTLPTDRVVGIGILVVLAARAARSSASTGSPRC